jgi:hypothetical protein
MIASTIQANIQALTDLLHLWHGRRATVRIKAELIVSGGKFSGPHIAPLTLGRDLR